jgi:hypothetical protein
VSAKMTAVYDLERNYRAAFLRYLPRQDEAALHVGYQIGRAAVEDGLSILELAQVHHKALVEVLIDTPSDDLARIAASASDFFLQVLATYDLTQRAYLANTSTDTPEEDAGRSRPR